MMCLYEDAYMWRQWEHNFLPTMGGRNNWQLRSRPLKCHDIAQTVCRCSAVLP